MAFQDQNRPILIQRVILENFLSFERDEIEFLSIPDEGWPKLILIIGPNWSGKTSIFQGIKFVLGSNERDNRYSKWADFVRDGSKHAMVEIHLKVGNELIELRRLVLKGGSPFYEIKSVNSNRFKKVSANEVQNIISNLYINPDNHFAFVSQGKIDAIKGLKPIELCKFLEEGIGLKDLREGILTQKHRVQELNENLDSLASKKNALDLNLKLLQPRLEKLKEKQFLMDKRATLEDELLWANRDKLVEQLDDLNEEIKEIEEIRTKVNSLLIVQEESLEIKEREIKDFEQKIGKILRYVGELEYKKKSLLNDVENWQKKKLEEKREIDRLKGNYDNLNRKFDDDKNRVQNHEKEANYIQKQVHDTKEQIHSLIKEQEQITKKIEQSKDVLEKYNSFKREMNDLQLKSNDTERKAQDVNHDINEIFQSLEDIEHKLQKNEWFMNDPSLNLLRTIDNNLKLLKEKNFETDSKLSDLNYKRSTKLKEMKQIETAIRNRETLLPSNIKFLKEEIKKRKLNVKGPMIDYLKYDDNLSYAIESVLGEKVLYGFIAGDWDTLNLLKRLKTKFNAYCNIYLPKKKAAQLIKPLKIPGVLGYLAELIKIIDDDEDIKKVIYSKVRSCLVIEEYVQSKQIYNEFGFNGKCVTLKGEQIVSYKYVYETPFQKNLKGFLSFATQKEHAERLQLEIQDLSKRITELDAIQENLNSEQKTLYQRKADFNDLMYFFNQKQRLTTKKNDLYNIIHHLELELKTIESRKATIAEELKLLESQMDPQIHNWNERIIQISSDLLTLNGELKEKEIKVSEVKDLIRDEQLELKRKEYEVLTAKQDYEMKKQALKDADKAAFTIFRELESLEDLLLNSEKELKKYEQEKESYLQEKDKLQIKHNQLKLDQSQNEFNLHSILNERNLAAENLERINEKIGKKVKENGFQIRSLDEIKQDILKIEKDLMKYYDIDDSILIEREQILNSLKELSKNQKSVHLDIKAALKAEDKMEITYYDKFDDVIKDLESKINDKFKKSNINLYCSLELEGKFEELGVLVKAAVSRDQLKACTALSGGQISIISICFILSLQELNPSPICMLDEAAMFLDDKNAEISYKMIKNTLNEHPIQLLMFLPKTSSILYSLADKVIGVARIGKKEVSTIFYPKIVSEVT
jgi:chromosome segregation protein